MAIAGPLVDAFGARWLWGVASVGFLLASFAAVALARGLEAAVAAPAELERAVPSRV
jgi:hypothetical protein